MIRIDKEDEQFLQRINELCNRACERYSPEFTHFLDARQLELVKHSVVCYADRIVFVTFGGFSEAERCVAGFFPKDIYGFEENAGSLREMFDLKAVEICGSGFSTFTHRDCMGSLLGLGIKRESLGDIYVDEDGKKAYACLTAVAADFVVSSLEFVSRDKVKVKTIDFEKLPCVQKKYLAISSTVASFRLDCVLSAAVNVSREKAKQMIVSGLVNVNHFEQTRVDFEVCENDLLSVKGYGRYSVAETGKVTRKGRNRIVIHKMI